MPSKRITPSGLQVPSEPVGRVADLRGRPARDVDLLELPVGDESEEPAVGRPERTRAPSVPGERLRRRARSSGRTQIRVFPAASVALNASIVPSGEMRGASIVVIPRAVRDLEPDDAAEASARGARSRTPSAAAARSRDGRDAPRELLAALPPRGDGRRQRPPASRPPRSTGAAASRRAPSGPAVLRLLGEARLHDAVERRRRHRLDRRDRRRLATS